MTATEWQTVRVRDLIKSGALQVSDGYRVTNRELGSVGVPFVRGGDIGSGGNINADVEDHVLPEFARRVAVKLTRPGDVAFITKGTVGRVGYVRDDHPPMVFAPQVAYWRSLDHARLHPRFIYYLLSGPGFQANLDAVKTHGSMAADYVSIADQQGFLLTVPPLEAQREIAEVLGALDDKIEMNRRTNETLDSIATTEYRSLFADLELGSPMPNDLPDGWSIRPIGDCVTAVGGSTPSTEEPTYWGGSIPFATPKDMSTLTAPVLIATERHITDVGLARISSGLLPVGTVLLSSRAPIGYLAITDVPVAVNQGFIAMRCDGLLPNHYVLHWARDNMDTIVGNANGTTFLEISKRNFRPIPALVPPPELLAEFTAVADPLHRRITALVRESVELAALRDTLLPRLLSGELRVRDAEPLVAAAV